MIRFRDALTLSVTKLKTRRIRLIVTTLVSGLFFVILAFASLVFTGTTRSIEEFSKDGFGKRYVAQVSPYASKAEYGFYEDKTITAQAKEADKKLIESKKAEAKRLGVTYDSNSEPSSVSLASGQNSEDTLNLTPQVQDIVNAYREEAYASFFTSLEESLKEYDTVGVYKSAMIGGQSGGPVVAGEAPTLSALKDGKEQDASQPSFGSTGFSSIANGITAVDIPVIDSFVFKDQSLDVGADGAIPVVAPYSAVEEALGFTKLGGSTSSEKKLARLLDVRAKAAGTTFQICLRNQASVDRQNTAKQQQEDFTKNKGKKDYVKPDLMYEVASSPCSDVVVARDVRSADTKKADAKQDEFNTKFGKQPAKQRIVTFRIIGVAPDSPGFDQGFSVRSIVTSILSSNLGSGWYIPVSAQAALPEYASTFEDIGKIADYTHQVLVEFSSADEAKRFQKDMSCNPGFVSEDDVQKVCDDAGTPFSVSSFGSNSVAVADARKWFDGFFAKASLVVAAISAFIMMGTIGKVIADSRRETAVFRAIGAKRVDIASVYLLYALLLGLIVAAFAFGAGFGFAQWFDLRNSGTLSVDALTIYNSQNLEREFHLVGFDIPQLLRLAAVIISAGLISSLFPLFNNLKRNPIKDMRDER